MSIAVVSWLQSRVGFNILGDLAETPEDIAKASSLKDIARISGRISSLREDLDGFLAESQAKLVNASPPPTEEELEGMKSLYDQQTDVFTKQVFALDQVSGDEEVREKRKHCSTEIQVILKDIEEIQKVIQQCKANDKPLEPEAIRRRLSLLSMYDLPSTLDPKLKKAGKKVGKVD